MVNEGEPKLPTDLGRPYNIDWRGHPPHMLRPDIPVWWRFIEKWASGFLNLYYDCLLGGPYLSPGEKKDPLKRMWRINISKRADAIAELDHQVWIIEANSNPNIRALGQLLSYRALWIRDPKINKPEKMVLVSETVDQDLLDAAGMYGILIFVL